MILTSEPATTCADFTLEQMTEHDLVDVVEIEDVCGLSPWGWNAYYAELEKGRSSVVMQVARKRNGGIFTALHSDILGFFAGRLVGDDLHVNNIAVHPMAHRRGIGTALLKRALIVAAERGAKAAWLEVRQSNRVAQGLYHSLGFVVAGRRRNYYTDPVEDALVMKLAIGLAP